MPVPKRFGPARQLRIPLVRSLPAAAGGAAARLLVLRPHLSTEGRRVTIAPCDHDRHPGQDTTGLTRDIHQMTHFEIQWSQRTAEVREGLLGLQVRPQLGPLGLNRSEGRVGREADLTLDAVHLHGGGEAVRVLVDALGDAGAACSRCTHGGFTRLHVSSVYGLSEGGRGGSSCTMAISAVAQVSSAARFSAS